MLEPTQDIPTDTTQPEVDDKAKRYRQAAEYNATLIQQRQERGPFYYEPHTRSVQVLASWIVGYNSSWSPRPRPRPPIIKLTDLQQQALMQIMQQQQQRQADHMQQQQQLLFQQQIVQQQILHQHHMEQQIKLHNQQRELRDQPPQEVVVYNENGEIVPRPKAAITTFIHFSMHNREALKRQHPHMNITDISKLMGSKWHNMSKEEQKPYMEKAKEDKRRFDRETEEYQKKLELFLKNRSWATRKPGAAAATSNTTNTTTTTTTTTSDGDNKAETSTSVDSPSSPSSPSSPAQQPNKREIKREPAKTPAGAKCETCGGKQQGPGQLVTCVACTKSYHPLCLQIIPDAQEKIKQEAWKCIDCKICEVCNDPGNEDKLMICDACDSGYHTFCLNPPLNRPPLGGWRCQECVKCLHCGSKTPGTGASCKWRANYTACDSCYQLYLDGKFCPVCERVYRFTDKTPMVECEGCSRWVHIQCDNIDEETYKQMAEGGSNRKKIKRYPCMSGVIAPRGHFGGLGHDTHVTL